MEAIFTALFVAFALFVVVCSIFYSDTCPKCKSGGALEKTGKTKGILLPLEDVKCKYCGYRKWRVVPWEGN